MKHIKLICVLCLLFCSLTVQALAAPTADEKRQIIKDYYFTEAVNIAAKGLLFYRGGKHRRGALHWHLRPAAGTGNCLPA